jgi:hypothetical protein
MTMFITPLRTCALFSHLRLCGSWGRPSPIAGCSFEGLGDAKVKQ